MGESAPVLTNSKLVYDYEECESKDGDKFAKGKGDRISELPDEILVFILSFMTLKEAAVTSVVARRWMPLWASISHLYFDAAKSLHRFTFRPDLYELEREKYVNLVNRVLGLHNGPCLNEFRIHFDLDKTCQGDINEWLRFALTKRLQRLELDFSQSHYNYNPDSSVYYTFPFHQLGPAFLGINPRLFIGFNSLKALHLNCVHVTGGAVECILSICSLLETLSVWRSHDFGSLKVAGPLNLNYLEISDCEGINTIQIDDTPNLVSFIYRGPCIILLLENVPLLTQVCLGGNMSSVYLRDILCSLLTCCFSQLQILSLKIYSPVRFDAFGVFPRFPKLKHLTLLSGAHQEFSLLGVTKLIEGAPYLQKFELQLTWNELKRENTMERKVMKMPHEHLKVVEFGGYYGRRCDFELVMYFFENAVCLEKMVINPRNQDEDLKRDLYDIFKEETDAARSLAHQQLKGKEPSGVELTIL